MTHGTIAGMLLSDLIQGRENEWATLYDPSRVSLKAATEFVKENLNVAAQYRDYATGGDVDALEENCTRHGRADERRPQEGRRLSGQPRKIAQVLRHMSSPWLHRLLEFHGEKTGIVPVTGLALIPRERYSTALPSRGLGLRSRSARCRDG
jgi:hypothetical protein